MCAGCIATLNLVQTSTADLDPVAEVLAAGRVAVLTGAGISTDSGIPDYRGPDSPIRTPMTYQQFCTPAGRRRYWARSFLGWNRMSQASPNVGHRTLAHWQQAGLLSGLITQNVDGLHQLAGSAAVIDLHGRIDRVICLSCSQVSSRRDYQQRLTELNPDADIAVEVELAPDGDALVDDTEAFVIADCRGCGGMIKPDVVFFGESVPPANVRQATSVVDGALSLLVLGSSLTVYSGRRFVRQAVKAQIPVLVINRGPTRADDVASLRLDAGTSDALVELSGLIGVRG